MASGKKQSQQFARQLLELSLVNGAVSPEHVAGVLAYLERTRPGVLNLNVAVREWNEQIVFLRKIVPGRADQSYGIQVARLAGLPDSIIARAKEILGNLEKSELNTEGQPALAKSSRKRLIPDPAAATQLPLF